MMKGSLFYTALTIIFLHPGAAQLTEDSHDYDDDNDSFETSVTSVAPVLLTGNVEITAIVGESVILPCEAETSDVTAVHWNKTDTNYGTTTTTTIDTLQDDRFQLTNGTSLKISAVVPTDTGSYTCWISTEPEREETHTLLVKSRPSHARSCAGKSDKWIDLGGDYCYLLELEREVTWIEAVYQCLQEGGHLATLTSMEEVKRIHRHLKVSEGRLYIGLWKQNDGNSKWVDKSLSDFRNWANGEPNGKTETCVEMYQDSGKWNDIPCNKAMGYICSALKSSIVSVPMGVCPDSSSEWKDYGTDYCYIIELYNETTSDQAAERCSSAGGSLASFHSVEEVSVVREQIRHHHDRLHIGFRQNNDEKFEWMDRSPVDLEFWDIGEPNDIQEQCGEIYPNSGWWNDIPCDKSEGYICSTPKVNSKITAPQIQPSSKSEQCGTEINADSGTIRSPNYPENYGPNLNCFWKITVPESFQIEISFQELQLEYGADCEYDYIEVLDGNEQTSTVLRKLCGSDSQQTVLSPGNKMAVKFSSDQLNQRKGFLAEFKKVGQCGGSISAEKGIIHSRNYPQNYPSNDVCTWKIAVPENNGVVLKFQAFEIEGTSNCFSDYVEILDGHDVTSPVLERFCGFYVPYEIRSSGHKITVRFVSDAMEEYYGFLAEFEKGEINDVFVPSPVLIPGPHETPCALAIDYDKGLLVSPHYPAKYQSDEECTWTIKGAPGSKITLRFKMFEIEYDSSCSYDYVEVRDGSGLSSPSLGKFCGNDVPGLISATGNEMTVHFRSDSSSVHPGFSAVFNKGEDTTAESMENMKEEENVKILVSDEGIIQSPNYPSNYGPNDKYTWKIAVPVGHQVILTFTSFKVETHVRCAYDYVLVRDGYSSRSRVLAKLCGYEVPTKILSPGNKMMIVFNTDSSVQYSGFSAEFTKVLASNDTSQPLGECGGEIYAETGTIQSPNYPLPYGPLQDCTWTITVPENNIVYLKFDSIELEGSRSCDLDQVTVLDGDEGNSSVLNTFCYDDGPRTVVSSKNKMTVKFKSDDSFEASGFSATFEKGILCGETIVAEKGILQSPNVTGGYKCSWSIAVPDNYTILLKILGDEKPRDETFLVDIRDGPDKFSDNLRYLSYLEKEYSVRSTSNQMFVVVSFGGSGASPQFYAEFEKATCGGNIVGDTGVISSPNYPDNYLPFEICTWKITVPENYSVVLRFQSFKLEGGSCNYDYVSVYEGHSSSGTLLGQFCGLTTPPVLTSFENKMYVKFVSDSSTEHEGFSAQFEKGTCGGYITGDSGVITSPNYPENYGPSQTCMWKITVPENYQVVLEFLSLKVGRGPPCNYDYVEVYEGLSSSDTRLGKFCGSETPRILRSTGNEMYVQFVSDSSTEYEGFSAQFKKDICGGTITAETGIISSPDYPSLYPRYSDCTWILVVPEGNTINLQFNSFSVEFDGDCDYDYVKIFDGPDPQSSPLLQKSCGSSSPDPVQSTTNTMSVRFISDGSDQRNGFTGEFSTVSKASPTELPSQTELENVLRQFPGVLLEHAKRKPKPSREKKKKQITKRSLLETLQATFKLH